MKITDKEVMKRAAIDLPPMRTARHLVTRRHTRGWPMTQRAAVMAAGAVDAIMKKLLDLLVVPSDGTKVPPDDLKKFVENTSEMQAAFKTVVMGEDVLKEPSRTKAK